MNASLLLAIVFSAKEAQGSKVAFGILKQGAFKRVDIPRGIFFGCRERANSKQCIQLEMNGERSLVLESFVQGDVESPDSFFYFPKVDFLFDEKTGVMSKIGEIKYNVGYIYMFGRFRVTQIDGIYKMLALMSDFASLAVPSSLSAQYTNGEVKILGLSLKLREAPRVRWAKHLDLEGEAKKVMSLDRLDRAYVRWAGNPEGFFSACVAHACMQVEIVSKNRLRVEIALRDIQESLKLKSGDKGGRYESFDSKFSYEAPDFLELFGLDRLRDEVIAFLKVHQPNGRLVYLISKQGYDSMFFFKGLRFMGVDLSGPHRTKKNMIEALGLTLH